MTQHEYEQEHELDVGDVHEQPFRERRWAGPHREGTAFILAMIAVSSLPITVLLGAGGAVMGLTSLVDYAEHLVLSELIASVVLILGLYGLVAVTRVKKRDAAKPKNRRPPKV